jgi:transcriptional regulator
VGAYPASMYVPPRSREDRIPVLQQAVDRLRFGTLVTINDGELRATHLPMLIDATRQPNGTLIGHIARNNPQWQNANGPIPAIATFLGPNYYVTPTWYATKAQTGKVVPTWHYIAVEARGGVQFFHDRDRLLGIVERLTVAQESGREHAWSVSDAPAAYIDQLLGAIVGFEMPIDALEGAWKLGQQKNDADRAGVAAGIAAEFDAPADRHARESLPTGHAQNVSPDVRSSSASTISCTSEAPSTNRA